MQARHNGYVDTQWQLKELLGGAEVVTEGDGWSASIPGLPVAADGNSFDEAIVELVDALREYAEDWRLRLLNAPNHSGNSDVVRLIGLSDDDQLRDWLTSS